MIVIMMISCNDRNAVVTVIIMIMMMIKVAVKKKKILTMLIPSILSENYPFECMF